MEQKTYELRPNSGSAFKNRRRRNDSDPALTGSALVDGKEYWFNCWTKKDKNGDTWISFSFNEKKPKEHTDAPPAEAVELLDERVPF